MIEMIEEQPEEYDSHQSTLADIFSRDEPVTAVSRTRKRYAGYRSYIGGNCENCDEPLGFIETEGGRDRHYCNARCRVQHHRKQQREKQRAATLQFNSELREYWLEHGVRGEVLLRLQEVLLQHGKAAARAATDVVLVACAVQSQFGNNERAFLIDDVLLGGETIGHEAITFDDFRVEAGVEAWCEFVSGASVTSLKTIREYIKHRQYAQEGRKRFEALDRNLPPQV